MAKRFYLLTLIFCVSQIEANVTFIPHAQTLKEGGSEVSGHFNYWNSISRYDDLGKQETLTDSEGFNVFDLNFQTKYGATRDFELGLGINFRQNQATFLDNDDSISSQSFGVQAITGSAKYLFPKIDNLLYAIHGFYKYTPYSNEILEPTDLSSLVLGDDGNAYGLGLLISYIHPAKNYINMKFHFTRPGAELSDEINYYVDGVLAWDNIALMVGAEGVYSLQNDPFTDDPENKPLINTGRSRLYGSINRQLVAPFIGANLGFGKIWRLEARYSEVYLGRATDGGQQFSFSLVRRNEEFSEGIENKFKEYDFEAEVLKVSPKNGFVILNKGLAQGVSKGMVFDLYNDDYLGGNTLLARGIIVQINSEQAVLKITSRFSNKFKLKEGTQARAISK